MMTPERKELVEENILDYIKRLQQFKGITRKPIDEVSADDILVEAEAIGRYRNPSFVIDDNNEFAYRNVAKWIAADPTMECIDPRSKKVIKGDLRKGLYISGPTGTGKSWLIEILGFLARAHKFTFATDLKEYPLDFYYNYRADEITSQFLKDGDMTPFTRASMLVINDIGTEQREVLYMGNRVEVIKAVLEKRGETDTQLTVITSNIRLGMGNEAIKAAYGDRVASRIPQMCNYIELKGNDRRK